MSVMQWCVVDYGMRLGSIQGGICVAKRGVIAVTWLINEGALEKLGLVC